MKRITFLLFTFSLFTISYGQTTCPESIKSNSTPSEPTFVLSNGQNGCNEVTWPATVLVDGLTYSFVSCSGGNLKYAIDAGQTPPSGFDVTVDYGNGLVCTYDQNGQLDNTLSNESFSLEEVVSVFPNPINSGELLTINVKNDTTYKIELYSILGALVYSQNFDTTKNKIDLSNLNSGMYMIKIITPKFNSTKKLIIN